jgi:hypothetical protein
LLLTGRYRLHPTTAKRLWQQSQPAIQEELALEGSGHLRVHVMLGMNIKMPATLHTRIDSQALRKLLEPWPQSNDFGHFHYRKKTANNACNP